MANNKPSPKLTPQSRIEQQLAAQNSAKANESAKKPIIPAVENKASVTSAKLTRAQFALQQIEAHKNSGNYGNYVGYVKSLPASILMNGLGQALAMVLAGTKKDSESVKNGNQKLFDDIQAWMKTSSHSSFKNKDDLIKILITGSQDDYVYAQAEILSLLSWLKNFAVAYLEQPKGGEE